MPHEAVLPASPAMVEVCAGTGQMGRAARQLGAIVVVAIDSCPQACRYLEKHHPSGLRVHCCKIEDHIRWDKINANVVMGGFPCQPYSGAKGNAENKQYI